VRTALDSNILSALWSHEPSAAQISNKLKLSRELGGLVVCAPVYAECLAHPLITKDFVDGFMTKTGIFVDFELDEPIWQAAAQGFAAYANRRRASGGGSPKRFLVDFVVAGHALLQADRLMTTDPTRYQRDFPTLHLI
jgi:predicted nucleic acid-binding protein